jgi:hypothetical protein
MYIRERFPALWLSHKAVLWHKSRICTIYSSIIGLGCGMENTRSHLTARVFLTVMLAERPSSDARHAG